MPRKAKPTPEANVIPPIESTQLPAMGEALTAINANLMMLADQLGYEGALTVGALEDEIRFYQRRSVEALLAVGTRLLLLKEMTPHGDFMSRIELLGFSKSTAQRFMSAALKTSKSPNLGNLANHIQGAGKFLELITLDDDELEALADGGTVAGLTLDDIDVMPASDLRKALREAKENEEAMARVLQEKNAKLDELAAGKKKRGKAIDEWNEQILGATDEISQIGTVADEVLGKHVQFIELAESLVMQLDEDAPDYTARLEQARVTINRLGEQIQRFGHIVARLQFDFEGKLSMYQDNSHVLAPQE